MPVDHNDDASAESRGSQKQSEDRGRQDEPRVSQPRTARKWRRHVSRRNALILGILIAAGFIVFIFLSLLAYRLGFVDRYVAGQIKGTLAAYGIRAEIREFHTAITPQTVEMLDVELYDAQTGDRIGKIGRLLATVRIEDLYALRLQRNINLKDLQVENLELWVTFDAEGRSNFRNIHIPPPEPNKRILFAYSTAHIELKNGLIHYGDLLHRLSGEARNLRATIQPDDPAAPTESWMNTVSFTASNSRFVYDDRPIESIDIEARGRVNQTRAEIQELVLRSPFAEAKLQGVMDDWRAMRYQLNVTSFVDLTQASDILQTGTTLRGAGNFVGTVIGEGAKYKMEGTIKSDALAADGIRLQGLNVTASGSGEGQTYEANGRAVAQLLAAGDFQLNAVQIAGGVMGTGTDFRWIGELRAAAERSYGTTITGLILRDARAEYRDGVLTASGRQLTGGSLSSRDVKVTGGIQASDLRVKVENGVSTAKVANARVGKIEATNATFNGVNIRDVEANNRNGVIVITLKEAEVGDIRVLGAQTGSINIAGVRITFRNGRFEGSSNDINVGTATLENGRVEDVKLAKPVVIIEPSGRYRASADLSLGGGVLGEMPLGPARASLVATSDQVQLNNFTAEALDGRATGNAVIALTKTGTSHVVADFTNFDVSGLLTLLTDRVVPVASKATGKADMSFKGTDLGTATGSINARLQGETQASGSSLTPVTGELALNADHGLYQIQRASLQTPATTLNATGQFSLERDSNLRVDLVSTDAAELQRVLVSSGAIPGLYERFDEHNIELAGRLVFNGTLQGRIKDPLVNGHAELGSLIINSHDLGSLTANIVSSAEELRVSDGRLAQANGGGVQFTLVAPRTGKDNISIEATLDRANGGALLAALPLSKDTRETIGDTQSEVSGTVKIIGFPEAMSGSANLRFGPGKLAGEQLQDMTARAAFAGSTVTLESVDINFTAGHIVATGKYDTATRAFDIQATGNGIQLERLMAFANRPGLPKLTGTADLTAKISGSLNTKDFSNYRIDFNGEGRDVTIEGRPAGTLTLVGRTENKQLDITFTTGANGLLGPSQVLTARVDLSNKKLPATVESTITGADLTQVLKMILPESEVNVTGRATGTLKASGNLLDEEDNFTTHALSGTATFTELSVRVEDVQLSATGPVVVEFSPKEITFNQTKFTGQGTNVDLGGTIARGPGGRQTFAVNGQVNLRIFNGVSPDVFSSGIADLSLRVAGTYENPRVTGTASLSGASVAVLIGDERITVANLKGLVIFNTNQAQIDSLTGTLGGGKVRATGGARLDGFSLSRFVLNIHGDNVTLNYPLNFRSTVDADLAISGTTQRPLITGDVHVRRTEYTKDLELAELINQRPEPSIEEGGEFRLAEAAILQDLRVEGRNALVVRNNLADLTASVSLRLNGPVKDPIIEGRITATSGTINFRNNPYEITRGLMYFPARRGADPIINIAADSVIRGYRVTVGLNGPLSNPLSTLSSEPALPQADVVSLVLNGTLSTTDAVGGSVLAQSGLGTAASLLTDTLINTPVSRASNKLFGLSRLEINPVIGGTTGSTPTARLTLARRISKDLVVTYSTNLASDPNQVLTVEYRLSNRLSFVAQYEQGSVANLSTRNNNYSFEVRFRKRF
jgi:translocation and assembly module TamB